MTQHDITNADDVKSYRATTNTLIYPLTSALTMTSDGNITVSGSFYGVDTDGSAFQLLKCIKGGVQGQILYLKQNGADNRDVRLQGYGCGLTSARLMLSTGTGVGTYNLNMSDTNAMVQCFYTGPNGWICTPLRLS